MDYSRLRELCGIAESIVTPVNAPDGEKHRKSATKANSKINKSNNKIPAAKSASDVRIQDRKGDIDNDVVATLDDIDDSGIEVKDGKKDVNGNKVVRKGERLTFTISIDDRGVPKIDDSTELETVDVETWGESAEYGAEGYIVVSEDQEFGLKLDNQRLVFGEKSQATVFDDQDQAFALSEYCQGSKVCKLVVEKQDDDEKDDDSDEVCDKCEKCPCECDDERVDESSQGVNRGRLRRDIQDRLDMGLGVRSNIIVNGKSLEGQIVKAGPNFVMVKPFPRTAQALGIDEEPQMVKVDYNALLWSEDKPNTVVGSGTALKVGREVNMDREAPAPRVTESHVKPGSLMDRVQKLRNKR